MDPLCSAMHYWIDAIKKWTAIIKDSPRVHAVSYTIYVVR